MGFLFDTRRVLLRGFRFCRGVQNVAISYTAGYASVPLDLKQAGLEILLWLTASARTSVRNRTRWAARSRSALT